jgi:lysophospholipase L1-like esterase
MAAETDTELAPDASERRAMAGWKRVFLVCVCAFLVWVLLYAPTLQHNAQVSPIGTRRTVALSVLGPVAATSRFLQLSHIVSETDALTGRTGNRPGNGEKSLVIGLPHHHHHHVGPPDGPPPPGSTSPTTLPDITHPSAAKKLRVLIVGDSLGIDMGGPLQNDLTNTGVVQAMLDARESTGLTRPDYFNWPSELQSDIASAQPQVVVIMMGANDPQDFPGPPDTPFASPKWSPMYADRVSEFMHIAASGGAQVIWMGMPPMQNTQLSSEMLDINAIDQTQAKLQNPPASFISCWNLLGTPQGTYTPFITNSSGQVVNVRTPDGTHLTPSGGEVLSQDILNYLRGPMHFVLP